MLQEAWRGTVEDLKRLGGVLVEMLVLAFLVCFPTWLGVEFLPNNNFSSLVIGIILVVVCAIEAVGLTFWVNYRKAKREEKMNRRKMLAHEKDPWSRGGGMGL